MAEMPMVLLNCRTALVSSLVVKRKNDHITMQWCETPGWFSVHRRFGPTRVVVWRTSIPFTALLGKYKKTFKMSGQCTTLSKGQNKEIIELPVPQKSTGGRHASCASWLTVIILYPKNCMVLYFQVVGRYRHQIQRVLLPDLYQTLQESR
jgi:hypothetical protein